MSTVITSGAETITPDMVLGYSSGSESGNIVHQIIGRADPDVTLRPASLRTGTLELLFVSESASLGAEQLHRAAASFAVISTDRSSIEMTYVVGRGEIVRELDPETRDVWVVRIPFQEVTA